MCDGLNLLLDNAGEALVDFAAKTESVDLQTTFFDAQHAVAMQGDRVLAGFRDELEQAETEAITHKPAPGAETLSLLERDAYERSVALETIANNCIQRNQQNFHALKQHLSALYGGRKFQLDDLPLNPGRVANSFETALEVLDISNKARLVLFTLFDRYVMGRLDDALSDINRQLAEAGVLPTIKYTVKTHPASTHSGKPPAAQRVRPHPRRAAPPPAPLHLVADMAAGARVLAELAPAMRAPEPYPEPPPQALNRRCRTSPGWYPPNAGASATRS